MENEEKRILFLLSQNDIGGHTKVVLNLIKIFDKRNIHSEVYIPWFTHFFYTKNYRLKGDYSDAYLWIRYFLGQIKSELTLRKFKWRGQSLQITPVKIKRFIFSPRAEHIKLFDVVIITGHFQLEELVKLNVDMSKVIYVIHHLHSNHFEDFELVRSSPQLKIIVSSYRTAEDCKNLGISNFSICKLGVDNEIFNSNRKSQKKLLRKQVGFFFYQHKRKNPQMIKAVISELLLKNLPIDIHIFGNSFPKDDLRIMVHESMPEERYAKLISDLDLFVYISRVEGFGLPPLEALACGVVTYSSDVGAINEMITRNNGMLFEIDASQDDWVSQITRQVHENHKTNFDSSKFAQDWRWERTADEYLQVILR